MDFRFTQDQQNLIDAAKAFFDGENTVERMRAMAKGEKVSDLWPKFEELGLLDLMKSEQDGGLEQPLVVMVGIAEAASYAGLPEPFIEVAAIQTKGTSLRPYPNSYLEDGEPVRSIDPLRKLVKCETDKSPNELAEHHGAVLTAAQLIGLSKRMLDMSVDYAKDRQQFGKPIGTFQAIKHQLANVHTQIDFTRPIIQLAAIKGGATVHNAKVSAIDTAMLAAETAIQVHGGMGYTYEVDLHFFMKRAWALCGEWGDRNYHMKKLEDYVFADDTELGAGTTFG